MTPQPAPRQSRAGALDDLLVLVVENDADVRSAMMGVLEDWGASPIEATTLSEAQAQIAELGVPPDVILADYQLDCGETGLALIGALRALYGPLPAVLITANHSPDLITQAEDSGILLLTKPLGLRRLRRLLQQVPLYARDGDGAGAQPAARGDHSYWLRDPAPED
jgi:two-component system, sensor histidine kinase